MRLALVTRVIVPIDLVDPQPEAVRTAVEIAGTTAEVHVVYALPEVEPNLLAQLDEAHRVRHARESLAAWFDEEELPEGLRGHCAVGEPSNVVVDLCRSLDAHLVVVHSEGRQGVRRFLLGSVAERIARRAPCPVLLLKHPAP